MKLINKNLLYLIVLLYSSSFGQIGQYNYKRQINGITDQWHKIILPDEIFEKVAQDQRDIRIFGIIPTQDTIEAPYLLKLKKEQITLKEVAFRTINATHNQQGYYYTFALPEMQTINGMKLDFNRENFDWFIKLEGSQDNSEWFTILDRYRILSIKNSLTDYQFTKVVFPEASYRYFRLSINSPMDPGLHGTKIEQRSMVAGSFREYQLKAAEIYHDKENKRTEIDVQLTIPVPVSRLRIGISSTFDYYRPVTIQYLTDSFKTEQGWKYNYKTLLNSTLTSIEKGEFAFESTTTNKLKIHIQNQDNQPLDIDTIHVRGYVHELWARFTEPATYFLAYGSNRAYRPHYDIQRFNNSIPEKIKTVQLGEEMIISKETITASEPLFRNKAWLWVIMSIIIIVLGWFTLKMIKGS